MKASGPSGLRRRYGPLTIIATDVSTIGGSVHATLSSYERTGSLIHRDRVNLTSASGRHRVASFLGWWMMNRSGMSQEDVLFSTDVPDAGTFLLQLEDDLRASAASLGRALSRQRRASRAED